MNYVILIAQMKHLGKKDFILFNLLAVIGFMAYMGFLQVNVLFHKLFQYTSDKYTNDEYGLGEIEI